MLAGPHPRSLSSFDSAQDDPELVEKSLGGCAPRSSRRRSTQGTSSSHLGRPHAVDVRERAVMENATAMVKATAAMI
jgi:hypothetical protein